MDNNSNNNLNMTNNENNNFGGQNQPLNNENLNQNLTNNTVNLEPNNLYTSNSVNINNEQNQNFNNSSSIINEPSKKKLNPLFIVIPAIIIVILIGAYFINSLFFNNYKAPVNNYCKLMQDMDTSLVSKIVPKEFLDSSDYNDFIEDINDSRDTIKELNADYEITCDISDGKKLDKEDLDYFNEDFQENYNSKRKISQAYDVNVKLTMKVKYNGKENTRDTEDVLTVGKIGGKWYIINLY